jgi:hypothetical protein
MMIGKDYMPRADAEFNMWLRNLGQKLPAIATAIGVPQALVNELLAAIADWNTAYKSHQKIHNEARGATENKNGKRAVVKSVARLVIGVLQANPKLTDGKREILDITVPDRKPTPLSPEYVQELDPPLLKLDLQPGQVIIHFGVNPGNEHENAKPKDITGVKLWYRVREGEWEWLGYDTNSPYRHDIDLGEALEYRAQWIDKKMRTGLFSMVAKATVS